MRSGWSFSDSFTAHFGVAVEYYGDHFFEIMKAYLSG